MYINSSVPIIVLELMEWEKHTLLDQADLVLFIEDL